MQHLKQEYIGLDMEIISSSNTSLVGLKGTIIDETKSTFTVRSQGKVKMILKKNCTFRIRNLVIDGNRILKRPENRIKMKNDKN